MLDRRYLTGVVLLSPVYLIHLVARRPEHGHFTVYFALPWLLPCAIWLAVFARRSSLSGARFTEAAVILGVALALCEPSPAYRDARRVCGSWHRRPFDVRWSTSSGVQDFVLPGARKGMAATERRTMEPEAVRLPGDRGAGSQRGSPNRGSDTRLRPSNVSDDHPDARRSILWGADQTARSEAAGFRRMNSKEDAPEVWVATTAGTR